MRSPVRSLPVNRFSYSQLDIEATTEAMTAAMTLSQFAVFALGKLGPITPNSAVLTGPTPPFLGITFLGTINEAPN